MEKINKTKSTNASPNQKEVKVNKVKNLQL